MINSTLAQHLFQILAPGQSCVLDTRTKKRADEDDNESTNEDCTESTGEDDTGSTGEDDTGTTGEDDTGSTVEDDTESTYSGMIILKRNRSLFFGLIQ